jgi:hypothetical protein
MRPVPNDPVLQGEFERRLENLMFEFHTDKGRQVAYYLPPQVEEEKGSEGVKSTIDLCCQYNYAHSMSRPLRIEYPGAWYHVMNRGRRSEKIFLSSEDYEEFITVLQESSK